MVGEYFSEAGIRHQRGALACVQRRLQLRLARERGRHDRVIERAPRRGQFQMVRTSVGLVRLARDKLAVGQCLGGAIDRHLVHPRRGDQFALGQRSPFAEHRHQPPFGDLQAKAALIFGGNPARYRVRRDRQPIGQKFAEIECLRRHAPILIASAPPVKYYSAKPTPTHIDRGCARSTIPDALIAAGTSASKILSA